MANQTPFNTNSDNNFGSLGQPSLALGVKQIMITTVIIYFAQLVFGTGFTSFFGLRPDAIPQGHIWQLATYMFLHDPKGIGHIAFNMLTLYFCGSEVERVLGYKKFLWFYLLCGIGGAILSSGISLAMGSGYILTIGASGAVLGVLVAFALMNPSATFLLFFIFPVKAKHVATLLVLINLAMALQQGGSGGVAVWAHLGGMGAGYLLINWDRKNGFASAQYPFLDFFSTFKKKSEERQAQATFKKTKNEKERLDVLLDKIGKHGMPSLTEEERAFLTNYSRRQGTKR